MAEVQFQKVTKRYGELEAVSEMSWTAEPGEFLVLFGPAGAGKTTTLELIAGLEKPDEGDILFDGQSILGVDTPDRNVAMAFENYALYPHMSVFDNIAFPMMVPGRSKYSKEEIARRVAEVASILQIDMLLDRMPQQLSGGQRQRVALGRCLVREPVAFLFDEPIAHLDAKLRHRMYAELKRIMSARGTTALYATPAQTEAMAMADRIVVIFEGKVQQIGSARDLYERPANVDVAKFGGEQTMNILPAQLVSEKGELWVGLDGGRIPVASQGQSALRSSRLAEGDVLLGIRPPDIECKPVPVDGALAGTVYTTEHLGRTTLVTVEFGERLIEVVSDGLNEVAVGTPIWLSFEGGRIYIFDEATTELVIATRATVPD
jgi:multiple sugar transport system ATP-binding protein